MFDFGVYLLHKYARFNRGTPRRVRDGTVKFTEVRVGRVHRIAPLYEKASRHSRLVCPFHDDSFVSSALCRGELEKIRMS